MALRTQAVLAVTLVVLAGAAYGAPGQTRISLGDMGLKSIRSVVDLDGATLIVADAIGGRSVSFRLPEGIEGGSIPSKRLDWRELGPDELAPTLIVKASNTGFVQVLLNPDTGSPQQIDWLSPDLRRQGVSRFLRPKGSTGPIENEVRGLYNWTVAADRIFAYGALDSGIRDRTDPFRESDFKMGFFTFRLRSPGAVNGVLRGELVETFREFDYYLLGLPFVAAIGQDVYYLEMGTFPSLYFYDTEEGGRPVFLEGFPGHDEPLAKIDGSSRTHELFAHVETLTMPAGLYADVDEGILYLLRRSPAAGLTVWTLTKLRPEPGNGRVEDLGTVTLPTEASHLTVHFTPESVLVFEKSSVSSERDQDVKWLVVLPRSWVTEPASSPLSSK